MAWHLIHRLKTEREKEKKKVDWAVRWGGSERSWGVKREKYILLAKIEYLNNTF